MTRYLRGASSLLVTLSLTILLTVSLAVAQDRPEEGGHELQVWTGGGHSVAGGTKWIFATRGHVAPYIELNGGTLFTTHEVPAGTSTINFTSGAAFGLHFLGEHTWSVDVRYMHISNAGLTSPNPGVNTVQVRLGFGKFYGKK
jgi:hypothetical protein